MKTGNCSLTQIFKKMISCEFNGFLKDKREFSELPLTESRSDICLTASDIVLSHSDILKSDIRLTASE